MATQVNMHEINERKISAVDSDNDEIQLWNRITYSNLWVRRIFVHTERVCENIEREKWTGRWHVLILFLMSWPVSSLSKRWKMMESAFEIDIMMQQIESGTLLAIVQTYDGISPSV